MPRAVCAGLLVPLALAGCIEADLEIAVEGDGNTKVVLEIGVAAGLFALAEGGLERFCAEAAKTASPDGQSVVTEYRQERGDAVCRLSRHSHIDELIKSLADSAQEGPFGGNLELIEIDGSYNFTLRLPTRQEAEKSLLGGHWPSAPDLPASLDSDLSAQIDGMQQLADKIAKAMFAGRQFQVSIAAPLIVETNSGIDDAGRATWRLSLAEWLASETPPEPFAVVFRLGRAPDPTLFDRLKNWWR